MSDKPRILVLEDDSNMLELLCEALEEAGYAPQGAQNSEQALELAGKSRFVLMVSDIRMAGRRDGLGTAAAVKQLQPEIKVVMITGYATDDAPRRAIELQVDDYVYKPFRIPSMLEVIERTLRPRSVLLAPLRELRRWLSGPLRMLEQQQVRRLQHLLDLLEKEKHRVFQGFFVAVRAKHLSKSAALDIWDRLEQLERGTATLPDQPERVQALGSAYRQVYQRLVHFEKTGHVAGAPARSPGQVSRAGFNQFFDAMQSGQLGLDDLTTLLGARQNPSPNPKELSPSQLSILKSLSA